MQRSSHKRHWGVKASTAGRYKSRLKPCFWNKLVNNISASRADSELRCLTACCRPELARPPAACTCLWHGPGLFAQQAASTSDAAGLVWSGARRCERQPRSPQRPTAGAQLLSPQPVACILVRAKKQRWLQEEVTAGLRAKLASSYLQ